MHITHHLFLLVFIKVIAFGFSQQTFGKWMCKNSYFCDKVNPNLVPVHNLDSLYNSLEVCRLVCGDQGSVWPAPTNKFIKSDELIEINPKSIRFEINGDAPVRNLLIESTNIFISNLLSECAVDDNAEQTGITIQINVVSQKLHLNWKTNESYSITADGSIWTIEANTFFGARHGLETLSQLVACEQDERYKMMMVKSAEVVDAPKFAHRGLLIDTSRNFLPVQSIKRQIDAMAASKLNVLHWHATDTQGFSYVSKRVPQLAGYGAVDKNRQYSSYDVKDLNNYAQVRGVRIILEIDMPAHAGNGWQWGPKENLGNLSVCVNQIPWREYCIQPPCGQLNPANPNVYELLLKLFKDIKDDFPHNDVMHMGGDEVFIPCWNSSEEIISYLNSQDKGQTTMDFLNLWSEFQDKALDRYDSSLGHSKNKIILWTSELTDPNYIENFLSNKRYVIQTWVPSENDLPLQLAAKNYKLIISTKNAWYLDHGVWGITQYYTWRTVYDNKLLSHKNVLGGEVCMWGEYVDEQGIDVKIWPRAAAAAERLWSDPATKAREVVARMHRHRFRLVSRGIRAETLGPLWCYFHENQCE